MLIPTFILVLLVACSSGLSYQYLVEEQWQEFKLTHKRIYANEEEEQFRMKVFMENMHTILEHNKLYEMNISSYKMGMNKFGDLTDDEFRKYYMVPYESANDQEENMHENNPPTYLYSDEPVPKEIDWRILGAVTHVKDQGMCGSCYAFSATGAIEAQHFRKTKKLVSLSEQNIVDCTYKKKYKNNGCLGGRVDRSFTYIIENEGIDTEESYPYKAQRSRRCLFNPLNIGARMKELKNIPPGNETELQKAVGLIGPVAVMVDNKSMRFYSGGIYDEPNCSSKEYTHGMLVVGYGRYKKWDYWIVKNSWGGEWGQRGYIMMIRNKKNQCAIATAALYPLV